MKKLDVWIEAEGKQIHVGTIEGTEAADACFCYADSYLNWENSRAVSLSLPLSNEKYETEDMTALNEAGKELEAQGFYTAGRIGKKILETGGFSKIVC